MSASLRWDVSQDIAALIRDTHPGVYHHMDPHDVSRWSGTYRPRRNCVSIGFKLPNQIDLLMSVQQELRLVLDRVRRPDSWRSQVQHLLTKINLSIGWPPHGSPLDDHKFLRAIEESPGDLALWHMYADWLQEQASPQWQQRGELIAAWLGPKPIKCKYGIPLLARSMAGLAT